MESYLSWSHVASGLSGIIVILIGYLIKRGGKQDDKLDSVLEKMSTLVTYSDCRSERQSCPVGLSTNEIKQDRRIVWNKSDQDIKEFKDLFYNHSHTELSPSSVVKIK